MAEPSIPYPPSYGEPYPGVPYLGYPQQGSTQPMPPALPQSTPPGPTQSVSGQPMPAPYSAPPVSSPTVPYSAPPGVGLAPVTAPYPVQEQVIAQIGEIQVTRTMVRTPTCQFPLQGSQWIVTDQWVTEQKTPTWAIVLAIVGFFCLTIFSLLFLLAKESVVRGAVQVHVLNGPQQYVARVPVNSQASAHYIYQQVNYVRSMATM